MHDFTQIMSIVFSFCVKVYKITLNHMFCTGEIEVKIIFSLKDFFRMFFELRIDAHNNIENILTVICELIIIDQNISVGDDVFLWTPQFANNAIDHSELKTVSVKVNVTRNVFDQ